tara:strand:- start:327 stop:1889 length:1563 start_codon:yes stop_codon:yes gene_type:complete
MKVLLHVTDSSAAETELKLSIDPKKLKDVASVIPTGWVMSDLKTRKLINTYYDTDDLRFLKAGCSLRVRETGGRFIQTIKSDSGSDALHRRLEQNRELTDNTITAPTIDDPKLAEQIGFLFPDDLVTIFSNQFDRRSMELTCTNTGTLVEVAFDKGMIRAGRQQQPFAEVEIELLEGLPADLYRLAQQFLENGPLYLSGETKSSRGYKQARGILPEHKLADAPVLEPGLSVGAAMRVIFTNCFSQWMANQAALLSDHDPEAVHQMRVALRRFRSALSLLSDYLPEAETGRIERKVRWIADILGPARDLDVFMTEILAETSNDALTPEILMPLRDAAGAARNRRRGVMRRALTSRRYTSAALSIGLWIETLDSIGLPDKATSTDISVAANRLLTTQWQKVLKRGRKFESLGYDNRHMVRIALKKLRYANEFFRSLYKHDKARNYGRKLTSLQDDLGFMNDMAMSMQLCENLCKADPENASLAAARGFLLGWQQHRLHQDDAGMVAHWRAFERAKPYWETGE